MYELGIPATELVDRLLSLSSSGVAILDSCGVGHLGSHLLVAGLEPIATASLSDARLAAEEVDRIFSGNRAAVVTVSYDLGQALLGADVRVDDLEPLIYAALFDSVVVHDYDTGSTRVIGDSEAAERFRDLLTDANPPSADFSPALSVSSNFDQTAYSSAIETIKEEIRAGNTYQTNLTRRIEVGLPASTSPNAVFRRLRSRHPAPFSAFIDRGESTVISASPERFFKISGGRISASPIKGTRPRGTNASDDERLRNELVRSEKDRAENTMIVDLLRNDLGRICEFGSVNVEKLCDVEEHPSLFHLVSTVTGTPREGLAFSEILKALFPCGSITGAPKISTMKIIDRLELQPRGLSMGAIGYYLPESFGHGETIDLSVAIRTMVVRDDVATFNVGGGIVIDSDPQKEWFETVIKSRALLDAVGIDADRLEQSGSSGV